MLAYVLAIAVGLSSLILFLTAFIKSDIHNKDDFLWSGVGLFYALVLWFCASRITGSVLLGQVAAVALVVSFNWQNLQLRKAIAKGEQQVDLDSFSITGMISGLLKGSRQPKPQSNITQTTAEEEKGATLAEVVKSLEEEKSLEAKVPETVVESEEINSTIEEVAESSSTEETVDHSDSQSADITTEPKKKGLSIGRIFHRGNKQSSPGSDMESDTSSQITSSVPEIPTEEPEPKTDIVESTESIESTANPTHELEVDITTKSSSDSPVKEQETISAEEIVIVPTVETDEESSSTQESDFREDTRTDSVAKASPEVEIEEIEVVIPLSESNPENASELNIESPTEEIQVDIEPRKEQDLIDVEFTPSETDRQPSTPKQSEQEPTSSIDDFLADLDKSIDKSSEDKN